MGRYHAFVTSEKNGRWSRLTKVLSASQVNGRWGRAHQFGAKGKDGSGKVSCAPAGNCQTRDDKRSERDGRDGSLAGH